MFAWQKLSSEDHAAHYPLVPRGTYFAITGFADTIARIQQGFDDTIGYLNGYLKALAIAFNALWHMLHGNTTSTNAHYFRDMFKTLQSRATPQTDNEGYQVSIASTGDFDDHEQHPLVLDDGMDTPSAVRRTPEVYRERR